MQVQAVGVSLVQTGSQTEAQAPRKAIQSEQEVASPQSTTPAGAANKPDRADDKQLSVEESVEKLNETVAAFNRSLQFSIDKDTRMNIVKVVDVSSKEVIRQIPSQEVVEIAKAIDKLQGLLLSDKA
ncbi:flagellar protein FlaG [Chitinimonas sp. PSY-7]|uniref:flagellar protein FlaG n=1 Tax=Chitinimonas sp. PSY-7 TaxID=3459088 RepID=UPI00403FF566